MKIILNKVEKIYDDHSVLDKVSVSFECGFIGLTGQSGSGKTTLIKIIMKEVFPDSGDFRVEGFDDNYLNHIAYSPVDGTTVGCLTVFDNLYAVTKDKKAIEEMLQKLDLVELKKKKCSKLSKGEQARVCIARVLLMNKQIVILDEPSANLDEDNAELVFKILKEESLNRLVIIATHDREYSLNYCDFVYFLDEGQFSTLKETKLDKRNNNSDNNKTESSNYPLYKLGVKTALIKKLPFIISNFLLIVGGLLGFIYEGIENFDEDNTIRETIRNSGIAGINCSDKRLECDYFLNDDYSLKDIKEENKGKVAKRINLIVKNSDDKIISSFAAVYLSEAKNFNYVSQSFDFSDYSMYVDKYKNKSFSLNSPYEAYYPVVLKDTSLENLNNTLDLDIKVGDLLPIYLNEIQDNDYLFTPRFVLVDTYKSNYINDPMIIPDGIVEEYSRKRGMYTYNISRSINNLIIDYNNYVILNDLGENFLFRNYSSETSITSKNMYDFEWYYVSGAVISIDAPFVLYGGKIPTEPNEIMIPNMDLYYNFFKKETRATRDFFKQFDDDGFPGVIDDDIYGHHTRDKSSFSLKKFKVVGWYNLFSAPLKDDNDNFIYDDYGRNVREHIDSNIPIILSDADFESAYSYSINEYWYTGLDGGYLYSPEYIANNYDLLKNNTIHQSYIKTDDIFDSLNAKRSFFQTITIGLIICSFVVDLIYTSTLGKELIDDYNKMKYWGVTKKKFLITTTITSLALIFIPIVITFTCGAPIFNAMIPWITNSNIALVPVYNLLYGLLLPLAVFALLYVFNVIFVYISMMKKRRTKNGKRR